MAAELEYAYLDNQNVEEPGTGHFKANNLMANLMLRYPKGMIRPYIGGGVGWSWGEFPGSGAEDETSNAFGWQALAGINLAINQRLSADFAYRFFKSTYNIGDLDATATDNIILVGLNYHFGGVEPVPPPPPPPEPEPEPIVAPVVKEKKCPNTPSIVASSTVKDAPLIPTKMVCATVAISVPIRLTCCIVDENGCPKDSDKDGVCDGCDKCPDTPAGVKVDKDGCPLPEIVEKGRTTLEVLFDFDKSTIKGDYSKDIDALADVMKKYEDLNVTIEGHTDNLIDPRSRTTIRNFPRDALML